MKIVLREVTIIRPSEQSPRFDNSAADAVGRSIKEFDFRQPIVVGDQGVVIAGHTRWKAAEEFGLTTVSVVIATALSPHTGERLPDHRQLNGYNRRVGHGPVTSGAVGCPAAERRP
ncbi:MAG: ParB N-terminal domain-containing protein [Pirellulaceae bacterium]